MQRRNWSTVALAASSAPSALLLAYMLWYVLVYRPSGQEAWGDGARIFYLGTLTYPSSLILLLIGTVMAVRWRRQRPGVASTGLAWLALSVALLVAPFLVLFAASA
jgi:hypothetical protein